MNCVFLWYELCFFWAFFVVWIVFFVGSFFVIWIVFFCGMNCVFWLFLWYELCFFCWAFFVVWIVFFLVVWIVFFLVLFCGMNRVFFVLFCGMNCGIFLCSFLCFFLVLGSAGKAQRKAQKKTHKKHEKSTTKSAFLWKKMNLRPPALDSLRTSGPANVSHHFPFSNLLSKKNSQEWAHARSGNVKKCNYHMMFIKNLNNYCWRHAFVALFTYNLQWLDRLIAVSRYLRYAAFNIVKNVMSQNIVSWYWCNTLGIIIPYHCHCYLTHKYSDKQNDVSCQTSQTNVPTIKGYQQQHRYFDFG